MIGLGYGMTRTLGVLDTPMRQAMDYAREHFINDLDIIDVLTVLGTDETGAPVVKGLFIGNDKETHAKAAHLSDTLNVHRIAPAQEIVAYLKPGEYVSFWLGNKSVYRTGMGIEKGGTLYVLAPGISRFADKEDDPVRERLIEEVGYRGIRHVLSTLENSTELPQNLSVAAHCVHGSPLEDAEGEPLFRIVYCTDPNLMPRERVERAGFQWMDIREVMTGITLPSVQGYHQNFGVGNSERVFYVPNPGLTLLKSD
jgi:hypothetical protein